MSRTSKTCCKYFITNICEFPLAVTQFTTDEAAMLLARIPYDPPFWQILLSVGLLLLTFIGSAWVSAKIYKVGILMFGKKSTFADLWKWLKQK